MNILLICTRFPLEPGNEYLTNELAAELVLEGNNVEAVVLDWDAPPGQRTFQHSLADGVNVTVIAPRSVRGLGRFVERGSKWLMSSLFALREMRSLLRGRRFDGLICFSPATTVAAPAIWTMRTFKPRSYLVQWDFFPFHQRSIGLMGNRVAFAIAYRLEQALIRRFDAIGCMSPMNIAYLSAKFGPRPNQAVERLPIWGRTSAPAPEPAERVRAEHDLPANARIVVFGGQITEGRGVEDVLAAAQLAFIRRPDLCFLVIGQGRLAGLVKAHIAGGGANTVYRERIPRTDYLRLLAACDIGLVATVRNVDVPTFPSKIIDYLRAGIPIVASVEQSTDFGTFVEEQGLGIAVEAGNPAAILAAVEALVDDKARAASAAAAARACLADVFDVRHAARRIAASLSKTTMIRSADD